MKFRTNPAKYIVGHQSEIGFSRIIFQSTDIQLLTHLSISIAYPEYQWHFKSLSRPTWHTMPPVIAQLTKILTVIGKESYARNTIALCKVKYLPYHIICISNRIIILIKFITSK